MCLARVVSDYHTLSQYSAPRPKAELCTNLLSRDPERNTFARCSRNYVVSALSGMARIGKPPLAKPKLKAGRRPAPLFNWRSKFLIRRDSDLTSALVTELAKVSLKAALLQPAMLARKLQTSGLPLCYMLRFAAGLVSFYLAVIPTLLLSLTMHSGRREHLMKLQSVRWAKLASGSLGTEA